MIKATALAIGALVGGAAVASVNFTGASVVTTGTLASELNYTSTGAAVSAQKDVVAKLGFGISAGQDRYIRIDLTGAKLAAAAAAGNVASAPALGAGTAVVSGGAANDTFVIYQVNGAVGGNSANDVVTITLPNLYVTNENGASVNVTYALYETAVAAANAAAGTSLYTKSGALLKFASGLDWVLTKQNNVVDVSTQFKKFTSASVSTTQAVIGQYSLAAAAGVTNAAGAGVALADFADDATINFAGDFAAVGSTGSLKHSTNASCVGGTAMTLNTAKNAASFNITNAGGSGYLCMTIPAANATAIPAQTLTAALDLDPATGTTTADVAAAAIGTFTRNGTELQAPFATIHPDYLSRVVLTSQHSVDAPFVATVIAEDGVACSNASFAGTLKAGKMLVINTKDICPSLTNGTTRLAVNVVIDAPLSSVHGIYNVMNYDQVTGKTNSLISYPMVRPTEN